MNYYAIMPASSGPPNWSLTNCRIEKAASAEDACVLAFGRSSMRREVNKGIWLAKDMGPRASVIQSDRKRVALLKDTNGWFDPYQ